MTAEFTMTIAPHYRKRACALVVVAALSLLSLFESPLKADVVMLKFSASLMNGTCTLSLDADELQLDPLSKADLEPNKLINPRPFTLHVKACQGAEVGMTPVVNVTGEGLEQDGKWLFRQQGSAKNVGIVVIKSNSEPGYNQSEVRNGNTFELGSVGATPGDQDLKFYAGVSCGGEASCASTGFGKVTATLMFNFAFQ